MVPPKNRDDKEDLATMVARTTREWAETPGRPLVMIEFLQARLDQLRDGLTDEDPIPPLDMLLREQKRLLTAAQGKPGVALTPEQTKRFQIVQKGIRKFQKLATRDVEAKKKLSRVWAAWFGKPMSDSEKIAMLDRLFRLTVFEVEHDLISLAHAAMQFADDVHATFPEVDASKLDFKKIGAAITQATVKGRPKKNETRGKNAEALKLELYESFAPQVSSDSVKSAKRRLLKKK